MKKEDLVPHQQAQPPSVSTLNMIDRNVVHYMAGYTAFQLLKRYKKKLLTLQYNKNEKCLFRSLRE